MVIPQYYSSSPSKKEMPYDWFAYNINEHELASWPRTQHRCLKFSVRSYLFKLWILHAWHEFRSLQFRLSRRNKWTSKSICLYNGFMPWISSIQWQVLVSQGPLGGPSCMANGYLYILPTKSWKSYGLWGQDTKFFPGLSLSVIIVRSWEEEKSTRKEMLHHVRMRTVPMSNKGIIAALILAYPFMSFFYFSSSFHKYLQQKSLLVRKKFHS